MMLRKKFFRTLMPTIDGDAYVIFSTGQISTLKYSLPNGVVQAGTNLIDTIYQASAGNAVQGLFFSGFYRKTTKYRYANDAVTVGTGFSQNADQCSAAGNAEVCHMAYGAYNGVASANVSRYTYANDSVSGATSLSTSALGTGSTGNKFFALFRTGINDGKTDRFEYSADTRITGVNLSVLGTYAGGSQSGNGTIGLMKGGSSGSGTTINKIQLAANVCTVGTALKGLTNSSGKGMAGTVNVGIFALNGGSGAQGCLYYYSADVTVTSAASFTGMPGPGVCANPQGVNV